MEASEVVKRIEGALEQEPKVNLHSADVRIEFDGSTATLSGEVENIAAKRLALERAAAVPEVSGIVDRLRVQPAERMGDGEIAAHIERALTEENVFDNCAIAKNVADTREVVRPREPDRQQWWIEIRVEDGIVTLDGTVPSLSHKRVAGAMAWWVPGSRDVINGLGVEPDERDSDAEILDALELVLEKDPLLDSSQIRATCTDSVVTLHGYARNDTERELAEFDAWAVFGVDDVINKLAAPPS